MERSGGSGSLCGFLRSRTRTVAQQILQVGNTIKEQEKLMMSSCKIPEIDLLKSFTGIGNFSALGLMLEIGTVERFRSVKALASYFGLHPVYKVSGDGIGGIRMSKMGRKEPRWSPKMIISLRTGSSHLLIKRIIKYLMKFQCDKICYLTFNRVWNLPVIDP
ncbi:MAG: IS110 family transposase, partial [Spirochaetes bacterium]|nr:IS110 family transposase [Spirochaetota bacterium]